MKNWKVMKSNASDGGIDTFVGFTDERWGDEHVCYLFNGPSKICDDRARLISAAPDMLEALNGLFEHCAMIHKHWGDNGNQKEAENAIKKARAAIAKAEGK